MGDEPTPREPDDFPPPLPKPAIPLAAPPALPHGDTLAYRDVHAEKPDRRRRFAAQLAAGLCSSLLICAGCFFLMFAIGANYISFAGNGSGRSASAPPAIWAWLGMAFVAAVLVGQVWIAVRLKRKRGWSGVLVGALIGVGVSLLPLGVCYAMVGSSLMQ